MFTAANPSPAYQAALEQSIAHQRGAKTWSGGLMFRHAHRIHEIIKKYEVKSILDYGCGKGRQYFRKLEGHDNLTVEELWGIQPFKYDPAVPSDFKRPEEVPLSWAPSQVLPPNKTWDLVIVTHVLGSIPLVDLRDWVIPEIYSRANKVIFVTENLNDPKKDEAIFAGEVADKPRRWTEQQWWELLNPEGLRVGRDAPAVEFFVRGQPGMRPRQMEENELFAKWRRYPPAPGQTVGPVPPVDLATVKWLKKEDEE